MNAALLVAAVAISAVQPRAAAFTIGVARTHALLRWAPSRAKVSGCGGLRARAAGTGDFPVLVEWLCARGGFVHTSIALAEDDSGAGRGLVATRAVRKGEQMIVVPRAAQLRVPQADEDAQLLALIGAIDLTPHLRILNIPLALRLLQEKCRPASTFEPYLRMLPSSYDAMPDYYAQHIPELQFSNVEQQAVARIKELVHLTGALAARAGVGADALCGASVDIGAVMWACGTASSRGFRLPWLAEHTGAEARCTSLLPVIDLINHACDPNTELWDATPEAGEGAVGVRALVDIAPATALRLRYGELTNEEMLLGLGFVLYHNPFDRLVVPPRALAYALQASVESFQRALALNDTQDFLSEADAKTLASKQMQLLREANLESARGLVLTHSGHLDASSMALVRVLVLRTPDEADSCKSALEPLAPHLQERAHDVVLRLCELALGQLPTSLEYDENLVQGLPVPDELASWPASPAPAPAAMLDAREGGVAESGQKRLADAARDWQGLTTKELGPAVSAVHFRIIQKQLLMRTARIYSSVQPK